MEQNPTSQLAKFYKSIRAKRVHPWGPERLKPRMKELGLGVPDLARLMAGQDDALYRKLLERINKWANGAVKTPHDDADIKNLCTGLGVHERWLRTGEGPMLLSRNKSHRNDTLAARLSQSEKSSGETVAGDSQLGLRPPSSSLVGRSIVPLRGHRIMGKDALFFRPDGDDVTGSIELPQGQAVEGAYALTVICRSMRPIYDPGDYVIANPQGVPAPGDKVVVQVSEDGGKTIMVYVRLFVSISDDELVVDQVNPPRQIRRPRQQVVAVHPIAWSGPGFGL
jgi:phage repressor protein C with HTH and peptisase S24 domain